MRQTSANFGVAPPRHRENGLTWADGNGRNRPRHPPRKRPPDSYQREWREPFPLPRMARVDGLRNGARSDGQHVRPTTRNRTGGASRPCRFPSGHPANGRRVRWDSRCAGRSRPCARRTSAVSRREPLSRSRVERTKRVRVDAIRNATDMPGCSHRHIIGGAVHGARWINRCPHPTAMILRPCVDRRVHHVIEEILKT